ncbi:HPP family protein [Sphingomonas sp. FW199]|uniref:HPP family protein n=1 Tax=Sphingomonas sp. FW199 TaxID=3400217 RepID=UPI003CF4B890
MIRWFRPMLAGARQGDRMIAGFGAAFGIAMTALIGIAAGLSPDLLPVIVAPMGASAVLIYAVPTSPLTQPWQVIGGNSLSALWGLGVVGLVPHPALAAGIAVGGAILIMSATRSLHPPGGASALTAVIGGKAVVAAGMAFPLLVLINSVSMVVIGLAFHRLISDHAWPHRPAPPAAAPTLRRADIDAALADMGETFDIAPADLAALLDRAEAHAKGRG